MKFLIMGLGSMGKRRIRNLLALGYKSEQILGFDLRKDRTQEAKELYNVNTINELESIKWKEIDAVIISTPPDKHLVCMKIAADHKLPMFVEASVIVQGLEEFDEYTTKNKILVAPSCTFRFHPSIKLIKKIVHSKEFGKVTNYNYISGQYLRDWHPWEDIKDFYVSKRETSGSREIVPFELTWLIDVFGFPEEIASYNVKTYDFGVDIDDTYISILKYPNFIGGLTVETVARQAVRQLIVNFENGQILWDWNTKKIRVFNAIEKRWIIYEEPLGKAMEGYHPNIVEEMYIEEMKSFIEGVQGKNVYPNTLKDDIKILKFLSLMESANKGVKIDGKL